MHNLHAEPNDSLPQYGATDPTILGFIFFLKTSSAKEGRISRERWVDYWSNDP